MNKWCIYMHINKQNNKKYIGQTKCQNPNDRWRNGTHYGDTYFGRAIQKYGWDNFEHIILEKDISTQEEANDKERYYIKYYDTMNHDKGYNLTSGGKRYELSEEGKKTRSEASKKVREDPKFRQHHSEKMKEYWSNHEERRQELGQTVKCVETGDIFPSYRDAGEWCKIKNYKNCFLSYFRGEKYSVGKHPDTKEPLHWIKLDKDGKEIKGCQNFEKAKSNNGKTKRVRCIETGEIFNSMKEAAEWSGLSNATSITNMIKGRKKSAGKHPETKQPLHWEFIEKEN